MSLQAHVIPPRFADCLDRVKDLIQDIPVEAIHIARYGTIDVPAPSADLHGIWRRIVLMPIRRGLDEGTEYPDKVTSYPFQVRIDVNPPAAGEYNADVTLDYLHEQVFRRIQHKSISLIAARQIHVITRTRRPLAGIRDESGFIYSSAKYMTVFGPKIV